MLRVKIQSSFTMNAACPCVVCGEGGHRPSKCPSLHIPLKDGFWSGGNGGGGHDHGDDDDEGVRTGMSHSGKYREDEGAGGPCTSSKNLIHKPLLKALLGVPVPVPL